QVVVTPGPQPANAIIDFAESADDERRRDDAIRSETSDHLDPVDPRQQAIHRHHGVPRTAAARQAFVTVRGEVDGVAAAAETPGDLLCGVGIVFDDEDMPPVAHGSTSTCREASPLKAA